MDGQTQAGFVLDRVHDHIGPGDVFFGSYRGQPDCRFVALHDDGGLWYFRDPVGQERPMRPSTMLAVADRHVQASPERRKAFEAIRYMRKHDCDFLTPENVATYGSVNVDVAKVALVDAGFAGFVGEGEGRRPPNGGG